MCGVLSGVVLATLASAGGRTGMALVVVFVNSEGGLEVVKHRDGSLPITRRRGAGQRVEIRCPAHWAWPALWAFLTANTWEDGVDRQEGTVTLFREGERLKVCFNDKDSGDVGFATLDPDTMVLDSIERVLVEDKVDWRSPRKPTRK